jgi:hypothetical protein
VTAGDDVARAGIWSWVRGGGRADRVAQVTRDAGGFGLHSHLFVLSIRSDHAFSRLPIGAKDKKLQQNWNCQEYTSNIILIALIRQVIQH